MYSFEGDFRRKPQQNLAGASGREKATRDTLLQHSKQQRQKREELRKKLLSAQKIQAFVRSFLTRICYKNMQRLEFDKIFIKHSCNDLAGLIQKILFFFDFKKDIARLISLSQEVLKEKKSLLKDTNSLILLRRFLALHLQLMGSIEAKSNQSLAIPLRMLETFTLNDIAEQVLEKSDAVIATAKTLLYLVKKGYFVKIRQMLDALCPPLYDVSPRAPNPMCAALFDLLQHPLQIVDLVKNSEYSDTVMYEFSVSFLSVDYSEPVQMYIIPAISSDVKRPFPFHALIQSIGNAINSGLNTSWMLYSVLALESKEFINDLEKSDSLRLDYLKILSKLTENVCVRSTQTSVYEICKKAEKSDSDSDDDITDHNPREIKVIAESIMMLNDSEKSFMVICSQKTERPMDNEELESMCKICHHLLLSHKQAVQKYRCLQRLAFRVSFLKSLWTMSRLLRGSSVDSSGSLGSGATLLAALATGSGTRDLTPLLAPLSVFCALYTLLLDTLHDDEISSDSAHAVVTRVELRAIGLNIRDVAVGLSVLLHPDARSNAAPSYDTPQWRQLFKWCVQLLQTLHTRDCRLHYLGQEAWTSGSAAVAAPHLPHGFNNAKEGPPLTTKEMRIFTILKEIPFVIPFSTRVHILQSLILQDKHESQSELTNFLQGPTINIVVRRTHLYEDAFDKLRPENEPDLRLKLRVQLINQVGADEAGVDGGGLFREFIAELLKSAFDPNRGLFCLTKDNMLFPNPGVHLLYEDFPRHYYFVGRMLGKALYESVLVEVPLAWFFLARLLGRARADLHELASLDPALRRGLLQLRAHPPHLVPDLGLDFTVLVEHLGEQRIEELKPNGANIPVTAENRIEYIHLVADYKLNKQIRTQCRAFVSGVTSVVPREWLQMFSTRELQLLISGGDQPIDVYDLKRHTTYSGGYAEEHPTICAFWNVVQNFTDEQKRQLLKFVTSCSRPPLLGFKDLQPAFCIQQAGSAQRLPSASTCMNLLKLPDIPSEDLLAEKLLYAIQSGAGFELS